MKKNKQFKIRESIQQANLSSLKVCQETKAKSSSITGLNFKTIYNLAILHLKSGCQ